MCCPALSSEKLTASVNPCCLNLWGHHYYFIFYFYIIQAELQKPFGFSHHKLLLWNVEIMWETFYEMYALLFILSMQWKQQTNFWARTNLNQLQVNHIASFHANILLDKKDKEVILMEQAWEDHREGRWGLGRMKKIFEREQLLK